MSLRKSWLAAAGIGVAALVMAGVVGGLAFAHPHAEQQAEQRGWLGVGLAPGGEGKGALVQSVFDDSAAEAAGIQEGDRIVAVDGKDVEGASDLGEIIRSRKPGDSVKITLEDEDGDTRVVSATLGERQEPKVTELFRLAQPGHFEMPEIPDLDHLRDLELAMALGGAKTYMGVELTVPSDQLRGYFGGEAGEGVLVNRVVEGTPAEKAGLRAGDLILSVDGESVSEDGDIRSAIGDREPGDKVTVEVLRDRGRREIEVTLGENPHKVRGGMKIEQEGRAPRIFKFEGYQDAAAREEMEKALAEAQRSAAEATQAWQESVREGQEAWRKAMEEWREEYLRAVAPRANEIRDQIRLYYREALPQAMQELRQHLREAARGANAVEL